jgi:hypothetical protein
MIAVRHFLNPVARKILVNPVAKSLFFRTSLIGDRTRRVIPIPYKTKLERPIFIVGSSRSGTSMLTRILGSSTELKYFSENRIVRRHMWQMVKDTGLISRELPELEKTLIRLSGVKYQQRLLEKTPGHSLLINSLANYFPDAQFIHIIRDGRDVALSMLKHSWIVSELEEINRIFWIDFIPQHWQNNWHNLSLWQRGIVRWAVYLSSAKNITFDRQRYCEISYENLCVNPENTFEKILSFLELKTTEMIKIQLSKIQSHRINSWQKADLSNNDLIFYNQIKSEFNIN